MAPYPHETVPAHGGSGPARRARPGPGNEVVISGISGIFPSSDNTQEFMENLFNKVDMITASNLNFDHPEVPKYMGRINGIHEFDAHFFRVTTQQALSLEPMSRKLLENAYSAMFDAGVNPIEYKGKKVGVFTVSSYSDSTNISLYHEGSDSNAMIISGANKAMFANRISYWLDSKGPSYSLDCACSGGLACLEQARDAILSGACDAAIVGGSNLCSHTKLTLNLSKSGVLCMDGKTKCFDQSGDGYVRSEAINVLFLQRAKDAKRIYAEVYEMQLSYNLKNDAKFLSTRDPENIVSFLEDFYSSVDVSPSEVEYVEAHGAAIAEADANELKAIDQVFCKENKVRVGCVKSNMGDSEPASGLCGLTKLCFAYHRGALPANLHFSKPQAVETAREGRVRVVDEETPFGRGFTALNNFSFTGINVHALLRGHYKSKDTNRYKSTIPRLVLASGRLEESVESLLDTLKSQPLDPEQIGLLHNIFETNNPGHMCRGFSVLDTDEQGKTVSLSQTVDFLSSAMRPLCLMYSGMGSQWPAMGAELMKIPIFAASIQRCHKALEPKGIDLVRILTDPDEATFKNIIHSFVGISAVQIGLTDIIKALGILPDYLIGHSMGEIGCGYFEDCLTVEESILTAYCRGLVSLETPMIRATMAAVGMGYKDILPQCPPEIDVACHNSAESTTISGPAGEVQRFLTELKARGIFCKEVASSNIAFHSRYMADVGPNLMKALKELIKEPRLRSSKWITTSIPESEWDSPLAKYCSAEYHTNNYLNPVLFEEASKRIPSNAIVVEVAPHGLMQAVLKRSHPDCVNIQLTRRNHPDPIKFLLEAVGKLYKEGYNPKVSALYPKIEYPVSTETPLLSHLVKWEHSDHCIVWWTRTKVQTCEKELGKLQRTACMAMTGAFRSTPTAALDIVLDLKLLHIFIQAEAAKALYRMKVTQTWHSDMPKMRHTALRLDSELERRFNMIGDTMPGIRMFKRNHKIHVPTRDEWKSGLRTPDAYTLIWYTDGSKTESGVVVIPEATLLCLVWETLAMYQGVTYRDLSVTFSEVHFLTEAIMSPTEPLKLTLTINKGNDRFEIGLENTVLASGTIAGIQIPVPFPEFKSAGIDEGTKILQRSDIYQILQLRGFGYKDEFQSVFSSTLRGSEAQIKWTDNWATFLDSLIQLNILAREHDWVSTPKIIKQLTINMLEQEQNVNFLDSESCYRAQVNSIGGVTRCAGVEIKNIIFNDKPCDELKPDVLETLSFIPHVFTQEVNVENVIQIQLQIIAENVANDTIKVTCTPATHGLIKRVSERMPTLNFHINDEHKLLASANVLVIQNLLNDHKKQKELLQNMANDTFILSLEQYKPESLKSDLFNVLSVATVEDKAALLLGKVTSSDEEVTYIPISRDGSFSWVSRVHNEMLSMKRVVLVSEKNPNCGSFGLVKKLRKEYNQISLVATYDSLAPSFDPELPFYKEQLQKNLTFNIFKKGEWGSYYKMPVDSYISPSMKIVSTKHGNLDFVKWMPSSQVQCASTEIQVCFAGPSMRDARKAVGSTEYSDGFGMDFSGINAQGKRVMGIVPSGALASHVAGENALLWPVPPHWSLQEGATVPLPYALACYCLVVQTQLLPGHRLLVTGGAGGLGQACIALALRVGATVFVTVGDAHKKRMLLHLFPDLHESHIGYSGCGGFSSEFYSKDRRYDIVVNCYSGALRQTAMKCVREFGIFLDFNEYDMGSNKNFGMAYLEEERTYKTIRFSNIFKKENSEEQKLLQWLVSDGVAQGWMRPVPRVDLLVEEAARAFNLVAAARLPGRVLLRMPTELASAATVPRHDGTALLVGAEGALATVLVERLMRRGVRRFLLHKRSNAERQKFWNQLGVSIEESSESLESEASCLQFLREGEELGPIREVYIVQKSLRVHDYGFQQELFLKYVNKITSVVTTLDQLSRNKCPELNVFVVITNSSRNAADEYAASVSEAICESRRDAGLPALALRIESQDHSVEQQFGLKSAIQSTLDTSLIIQHGYLIATKLKTKKTTLCLQKVAKVLGIKNIDDIDESLTLGDVAVSEVNIEEVRAVIKDTYKVDYTSDRLRRTPISSLVQIGNDSAVSVVKSATGLEAFYSCVDQDVYTANKSIVSMPSLLSSYGEDEEEELDSKETYLMLIPGFEGRHHIFKNVCERLKVRAVTFQLGPDLTHHTVTQMAARAKRMMQRRFEKKSKFYLLGYSFGINVALELAAMLEKEGLVGVVYCLDSSPDALRIQLDTYLGELSDTQLQCAVLQHFHRLMAGQLDEQFHQKLEQLQNWQERVELFVNSLKRSASYSSQYASTVAEAAYNRIRLARTYEPGFKLESQVVLVKGASSKDSALARLGDDYKLSKYTQRAVKVFDVPADHVAVPGDCRVPCIVNNHLDPELLDIYRNSNLCQSYVFDY